MNIVLMTSRSGSSLVCKILAAHGLSWKFRDENPMQNPRGDGAGYPTYEHNGWKKTLKATTPNGKWPLGYVVPVTEERLEKVCKFYARTPKVDFVKSGVEFASLWWAMADEVGFDVKFIKVRRPVEQVAASLARRGIGDAVVGAEVARRRFAIMDNIPGADVDTHILARTGLWRKSGIREALEQCGVAPRNDIIREQINPKIFHD